MSAQDGVTRVTSAGNLPTGPRVAYHVTPLEHAASIIEQGLDPHESERWSALDEYLERVAHEQSITEKPSHRGDCCFAYTDVTQGTGPTVHLTGYATLAIDLTRTTTPVYAASYTQATNVFHALRDAIPEWTKQDGPNPGQLQGEAYVNSKAYWSGCAEYTLDTELTSDERHELLFDGRLPPDAFTHVLD